VDVTELPFNKIISQKIRKGGGAIEKTEENLGRNKTRKGTDKIAGRTFQDRNWAEGIERARRRHGDLPIWSRFEEATEIARGSGRGRRMGPATCLAVLYSRPPGSARGMGTRRDVMTPPGINRLFLMHCVGFNRTDKASAVHPVISVQPKKTPPARLAADHMRGPYHKQASDEQIRNI
jgi:hypothetical protein